jgi:aminopeptidase
MIDNPKKKEGYAMDARITKLAGNLVNYSCKLQKGERVLIDCKGMDAIPLTRAIVKEVYKVGGTPLVNITDYAVLREIAMGADEALYKYIESYEMVQMKGVDAYISIRASENINELADIPSDKMKIYMKGIRPVIDERIENTKWVVLRYPNHSMAQLANTSTEAFEDFYFNVCNLDYSKMAKALEPLEALMRKTDKVHIVGPGTDLTFSIKGINVVPCAGEMNIPDGEIFTAPVRESINGTLQYNTPAEYQGFVHDNIKFTFKDGKIIEATSRNSEKTNEVLDTDEGGRYIGEFAIGVNPYITKPLLDTLFDEKIMGSFHFTPGSCYKDEAPNGNSSAIHWDLVCIQTEEYGGGRVWFDGELVRENGHWIHEDLEDVLSITALTAEDEREAEPVG